MKTKIFVLFFIGIFTVVSAQDSKSIKWIAKFGAAGGFIPNLMFPDYSTLNEMTGAYGFEAFEGPVITWGGGGYAYIMLVDNLRIGGIGFGGSRTKSFVSNGSQKEVKYFIGGGGLTVEYTFPFIKNIAVSVGGIIGGGALEIEMYKNKGEFTWEGIWKDLDDNNSPSRKVSHKLKNNYFTFAPTLNVDIPFNRFLAFRVGAGYLFSLGNNWEADNGQTLINVPDNLNANSFFIQTGLFIGLFAF